jgi:hypothetical protein
MNWKIRGDSVSTSRRLRAAQVVSAGLASVLLLGGCAAGTHPGAAATIGDKEISVTDLDKSTSAIQGAVGDQPVAPSAVLSLLVGNELAAQVLDQRSITVSEAEIAPATKVVVDQSLYQKFTQNPQTNDFLRASARALVGRIKLAGGTGITDPNAQQLNTEGTKLLEDASKKITVDVSPRYGKWDGTKVDGTSGSLSDLSEQSKPTPTPSAPAAQPPAEPQG